MTNTTHQPQTPITKRKADPTKAIAARKAQAAANDQRIAQAITSLQRAGEHVNVAAVARAAGVHSDTIRNRPELLAEVKAIRSKQWQQPARPARADSATHKEMEARWKTAQAEVRQLRAELGESRDNVHQVLGNSAFGDGSRLDEAESEIARLRVELSDQQHKLAELQWKNEDLTTEASKAHQLNREYVRFYNRIPQEIRDQYPKPSL